MRNLVMIFVVAFALTACAGNGNRAFTDVNNEEYVVEQLRSNPNGYQAYPSNLWRPVFLDPSIFGYNVKAIEEITGCKVIPETILNKGLLTTAMVDCK